MDIFGDEFIVPTSETNPVPLNAQSGASSSGLDFMSIDGTSSLVGGASVPDVLESVMDAPGVAASTNNDALDVPDSGPNMTSVASSVNDMFMSSPGTNNNDALDMTDSGPNITTESTLGNEMFQSGPGTNIDNAPAVDTDMFMSGVSSSNEDPAKDFLEKEKENLGDLGLDLGIQNNEVQPASEEESTTEFGLDQEKQNQTNGDNGMEVPRTGEADPLNDGSDFNLSVNKREGNGEPDCIAQWRLKQAERIQIKDKEEEERMKEMREKAKKDLEDWYRKYNEEVKQTKEENKVLEEAFLQEVHGLKPGTEWERVAKNCGFNNKVVHCKKDRSRMRNVILSLKQTALLNRS